MPIELDIGMSKEEKKADSALAVTLTYKNFRTVTPLAQFQDTILEVIRGVHRSCGAYRIYPELTVQGNIHYHMVVDIKDKIKWYKDILPKFKKNGFVVIKKASNISGWIEYCEKDVENMREILQTEHLPIVNANYKYFYSKAKQTLEDEIKEFDGIYKYYGV